MCIPISDLHAMGLWEDTDCEMWELYNMGDNGQIHGHALEECMPGRAEAFLSDAQKVYVSPYGCLSSGCCLSGQDERVPEGSQWELKSVE